MSITREQLDQFCGGNFYQAPWHSGDFTFATNGVVLVRVPRLLCNLPDTKRAPSIPLEWFDPTGGVPVMATPSSSLDRDESCDCSIDCQECDGSGTIKCDHCGHDSECEDCLGEGVQHNKACSDCKGTGIKTHCIECVEVCGVRVQRPLLKSVLEICPDATATRQGPVLCIHSREASAAIMAVADQE